MNGAIGRTVTWNNDSNRGIVLAMYPSLIQPTSMVFLIEHIHGSVGSVAGLTETVNVLLVRFEQ